jgi:hypothetical protein
MDSLRRREYVTTCGGLLDRIVGVVARRRETHNFDGGNKQKQ